MHFGLTGTVARTTAPPWTLLWCGKQAAPGIMTSLPYTASSGVERGTQHSSPSCSPCSTPGCSLHLHFCRPTDSDMTESPLIPPSQHPWDFSEPTALPSKCELWPSCICHHLGVFRNASLRPRSRSTVRIPALGSGKSLICTGLGGSPFIHSQLEYAGTDLPEKEERSLGRDKKRNSVPLLSSQF